VPLREAWNLRRIGEHDPARAFIDGLPSEVTWRVRETLASAPVDDAIAHGAGTPRTSMVEEDGEASIVWRYMLVPSTRLGWLLAVRHHDDPVLRRQVRAVDPHLVDREAEQEALSRNRERRPGVDAQLPVQ
jgi:hypothetical protein